MITNTLTRKLAVHLTAPRTSYTDTFCLDCRRRLNIRNYIYNTNVSIFNAQRILNGWYFPKSIRYAMASREIRIIREFLCDGVLAEGFGIIPEAMDEACFILVDQMDKSFVFRRTEDIASIPFETLSELLMQFLQFSTDYLVPYLYDRERVYDMEMSGGY